MQLCMDPASVEGLANRILCGKHIPGKFTSLYMGWRPMISMPKGALAVTGAAMLLSTGKSPWVQGQVTHSR